MKIFLSISLIFLLSFSIVAISSTPALAREQVPEFIPGQVIVAFNPGASAQEVNGFYQTFSQSHGISEIKNLDRVIQDEHDLQEKLVKVPKGQERKFLNILKNNPNVNYVGLNYIVHTMETIPNDSSFPSLWGLHNQGQTGGTIDADIDAPLAWDITQGSSDIVVGIVDTGIDYTHPDLVTNIWKNPAELNGNPNEDDDNNGYTDDIYGIDTVNGDSDPWDDHDHGTHVAGTIGGVGDNGEGVVGVNWNVSMIACKFLNAQGSGSTAGATECFEYFKTLKQNGVNIVLTNNSWGGGGFDQVLSDTMASTPNILHVIAAGNDNNDNDANNAYPANNPIPNKLVVAASDHNDNIASFSSYGANTVDLSAPGVSILSTVPGGGYSSFQGTSMATPHVVGAAALIWSIDDTLNQDKIQDIIRCNTEPISDSKQTKTKGRLNIGNALDASDNTAPSPVNLTIDQIGFSTIIISFTSVGDDGNSGTASCYEARYSTSPIVDETSWNNADSVFGDSKPKSPGNAESLTVTGLDPQTSYFIGVKVGDNAGNFSLISDNVSATTESGETVFEDDMEVPDPDKWSSDGLWHQSQTRHNSGEWSWHYADQGTNTYDVNVTPQGNSGTLETSQIDLTGATEASLTFSEWSEVEASTSYDRTQIGISTDGIFFTTVFESHGTNGLWQDRTINLNSYAGQSIYVGFNFDTIDAIQNNFEGWYVDDVKVIKSVPNTDPPINTPPTSNAGADQSVIEGDTVDLDGTGSSDSEGDITYLWSQDSGIGVTLDDDASATPSFPAPVVASPEDLIFSLVVTDDDGATDSDTVTITVNPNQPPTADAGADQSVTEGDNVDLAGSGSDTDGDIVSYIWTQPTGTIVPLDDPTSATPSFPAPVGTSPEDLIFSLVVTDDDGATDSDTVTITVNPVTEVHLEEWTGEASNKKRWTGIITITAFGGDEKLFAGATVSGSWLGLGLDDSCVTDLEGECSVSQTTKENRLTFNISDISGNGGTYDPLLNHPLTSITINRGETVSSANLPPTADAGADQSVTEGDNVDLAGSGSDTDGDIVSYSWTQPTGTIVPLDDPTSATPSFPAPVGTSPEDLIFSLVVTDDDGATDSDTVTITVNPIGVSIPIHVESIDMESGDANGPFWEATATITVHEFSGGIHGGVQSGVTVNGLWSGSMNDNDSCVTNAFGECSVTDKSKSNSNAVFTITSLLGAGFNHVGPDHEISDFIGPPP